MKYFFFNLRNSIAFDLKAFTCILKKYFIIIIAIGFDNISQNIYKMQLFISKDFFSFGFLKCKVFTQIFLDKKNVFLSDI